MNDWMIAYGVSGFLALALVTARLKRAHGWSLSDVLIVCILGPLFGWVVVAVMALFLILFTDCMDRPRFFLPKHLKDAR